MQTSGIQSKKNVGLGTGSGASALNRFGIELSWTVIDAVVGLKIEIVTIGALGPLYALVSVRLRVENISIDAGEARVAILAGRTWSRAALTTPAPVIFIRP